MRRAFAVLCIAGLVSCRSGSTDRAAGAPAPIDEGSVKAMSHSLLDAYDRADEAALAQAIGPAFTLFDELDRSDRDAFLKAMRARRDRQAPARSRTYGEEHVSLGVNSAVFIGETVEHLPLDGARPTGDFDGWSTLVWVRESGSWKAASWQWVKGGLDAARQEWNAIYREGREFNPQPSKFLIEMAKGRKPGLALDIGMGQGRNALYLASQGWRVTGIDISDEGLRLARQAAADRKLTIEAINADAHSWDYGVEKWDLAVMIYAAHLTSQAESAACPRCPASAVSAGTVRTARPERRPSPTARR